MRVVTCVTTLLCAGVVSLSAATSVVYTGAGASFRLATLNPATGAIAPGVNAGLYVAAFTVAPDGTVAYICGPQSITAVNTTTGANVWQVAADCSRISSSPDGATIYALTALNAGSKFISLSAQTGTQEGSYSLGYGYRIVALPDHSKAYLSGSGGVVAVNATTLRPIDQACVCVGDIGLSPDGGKLYVGGSGSTLATIVETTTDTVTGTIPAPGDGISIGGIAASGVTGQVLFGTNQGLIAVNSGTDQIAYTIASPDLSYSPALSTDGRYAYFCPEPGGFPSLLEFNLAAKTYKSAALGFASVDVQVVRATLAAVLLGKPNSVKTSDPNTGTVTQSIAPVYGETGLTVSALGNAVTGGTTIYPLDGSPAQAEVISVISTATHRVKQVAVPISSYGGRFATNPDASLAYVVTTPNPFSVFTVNLSTGAVEQTVGILEADGQQAYDVAASPDGNSFFFAEYGPGQLCRSSLPSFTNTMCVTPPGNPVAITVSADSKFVYLAIENGSKPGVYEYDAGTLANLRIANLPNMIAEVKVVYSVAANSLYVAGENLSSQGRVERVSLSDFVVNAQRSLNFLPTDMAVTPDGADVVLAGSVSGTPVLDAATLSPVRTIATGLTASVAAAGQ